VEISLLAWAAVGLLALGLVLIALPARWVDALEASADELEATACSYATFAADSAAASDGGNLAPSTYPPPPFTLSLLVRVNARRGRLAPSIQLRGGGKPIEPWVRLELVDLEGRLRHAVRRRLPASAIGSEFSLPGFDPPDGVTAEAALGWHWDVAIEDRDGERACWREHPRPAGDLNPEAELELAGCPLGPRGPSRDGRWYWIEMHEPWAPGGEFEIHCRECAYSMWVTPHPQVRENFPPPQSCPRCGDDGGRRADIRLTPAFSGRASPA
jgi:hypothetical protein